jgi:hypothetical protein
MLGKITKPILRPPFRPPQVPAAVRSSRLSCGKVGKAQIFTSARESSGESRATPDPPIEAEAEPIDNRPAGTSAVGCDRRQRRPPFRPYRRGRTRKNNPA